jgi:carbamoyltransferase
VYILGINVSHDSSACLLKDGELRVALALERITRVKRGLVPRNQFVAAMSDLIDYCLAAEGIQFSDVSYAIGSAASAASDEEERSILRRVGLRGPQVLALPHPGHHLAHASATFFGSGFDHACAVVIDAYGSPCRDGREAETALHFRGTEHPRLIFRNVHRQSQLAGVPKDGRLWLPAALSGIGEIYRVVTLLLGFRQDASLYDDAGKTMGLAPFGKRLSDEPQLIRVGPNGLDFGNALPFLEGLNLVQRDGERAFLSPRAPKTPLSQFHFDLAAQVQWEFEEAALHLVRQAVAECAETSLVLGGGCFLNSVLNHRIAREIGSKRLFIFPAATDDGNCYGAAAYAHHVLLGSSGKRQRAMVRRCGVGRSYDDAVIERVLDAHDLSFTRLSSVQEAAQSAAKELAAGKIVGWFTGGGEFGPRALGHRSILANPGIPGIKDRLNLRVKFRENFRPYGASVLLERVHELFELEAGESPHMLLVCKVRDWENTSLSGVTHVDGSCRIQTVGPEDDPAFYHLIACFERQTGVPVVLNTSFNLQGMPIVETPADAVQCYLATQMDGLFLGRYQVAPPPFASFVPVRRDLTFSAEGVWTAGRTTPDLLAPGARIRLGAPDSDAPASFSQQDLRILTLADGRTRLLDIAEALKLESDELIRDALRLYRKGLLRWLHLERRK